MLKELTKQIIKSKITNKKSLDSLIDEFIQTQSTTTKNYLDSFFSDLLIYINKNFDSKDRDTLLAIVESKLSEFNIPFETKDIETIYEKIALATTVGTTAIAFNKTDIQTIDAMRKSLIWAGQDYSEETQKKIKDTIESAYKGEITRAEITAKLKDQFEGVIDKDDKYFKLISDNAISQAQNISRVNQALKYGVKYFKVRARIDSKTSDICRSMNGKLIPASHLETQMNNILDAKDISDKKKAATWTNKPVYTAKLDSNFGMPPYHGFCRTGVEPVWTNEEERTDKATGKKYKVKNTNIDKNYKLQHIDKTGVEVKVKPHIYDKIVGGKHGFSEKQLVGAMNDIKYKAPHAITGKHPNEHMRSVALTNSGYTLVYEADELVSCFAPSRKASGYFNDNAKLNKITDIDTGDVVERVKKWYENLI